MSDKNFKELMQSYRPEKAPHDFTVNVMNRIYSTKPISEYKPVLNKWFLRTIYALFGIFLGYAIFIGQSSVPGGEGAGSTWDKVMGYLPTINFSAENHLIDTFANVPPVYAAIFVSAALLLFLDQMMLKRRKSKKF